MKLLKRYFGNVLLFKITCYKDKRGYFFEIYNQKLKRKYIKTVFLYDAVSINKKNVFRGLHYQIKYKQAKIISVLEGKIIDIIVDLRKNSKTYMQYKKIILSDKNNKILYIPPGYAHGFLVLSNKAIISYKISNAYKKKYEKTLHWNDKRLNLKLPKKIEKQIITSKKDSAKKV